MRASGLPARSAEAPRPPAAPKPARAAARNAPGQRLTGARGRPLLPVPLPAASTTRTGPPHNEATGASSCLGRPSGPAKDRRLAQASRTPAAVVGAQTPQGFSGKGSLDGLRPRRPLPTFPSRLPRAPSSRRSALAGPSRARPGPAQRPGSGPDASVGSGRGKARGVVARPGAPVRTALTA